MGSGAVDHARVMPLPTPYIWAISDDMILDFLPPSLKEQQAADHHIWGGAPVPYPRHGTGAPSAPLTPLHMRARPLQPFQPELRPPRHLPAEAEALHEQLGDDAAEGVGVVAGR